MNKCKLCGCTDLKACQGGCFWVDDKKTICSTCAVEKKTPFSNNINGSKIIIKEAFFCNLGTLAVTVKYENGRAYSYHIDAFIDMFTEVQS